MKKTILLFVVAALVFTTSGCGGNGLFGKRRLTTVPVYSQHAPVCTPSCEPACDPCSNGTSVTYGTAPVTTFSAPIQQ